MVCNTKIGVLGSKLYRVFLMLGHELGISNKPKSWTSDFLVNPKRKGNVSHDKTATVLSIESWLFTRDPYIPYSAPNTLLEGV